MPELPEVENVRRKLECKIKGRTITNVIIKYSKIILNDTDFFVKNIVGEKVNSLKRRGKWLIFDLTNYYLISHLRMEGKYSIHDINDNLEKHTHVVFEFDHEFNLFYSDVRKFGRMKLISKDTLEENINVGLEPTDQLLTEKYLKIKFQNIKLPIKTALLDQTIIAGIGNIYANEILYACKINPFKSANKVSLNELKLIIKNTKTILDKAILAGGSTIHSYESLNGIQGSFQEQLCVHGKNNKKCLNCGSLILKVKVNGRGTYYCPKCQKVKQK